MKPFTRVRAVAVAFRVLALFMLINALSVWLPTAWINSVLVWGGVGQVPDAPVYHYLLRGSGFLLLAFGVFIWVVATDVLRYQPLALSIIIIFLAGVPVSWIIGSLAGLPQWWRVVDSAICLLAGGIPLALHLWPSHNEPVP